MTTQAEKTEPAARTDFAGALVRLSHLVQHTLACAGREYDLTPQQAQLLCQLAKGPIGMAALGRVLHLEKSSLTGLIDRVERRGLVARVPDEHDRRALRVGLTGHGTDIAEQVHAAVTTRLDTLAGGLLPAEREQITAAAERLATEHAAAVGCTRQLPSPR
jgi:DNA-binding MarR family transcriptional regulator